MTLTRYVISQSWAVQKWSGLRLDDIRWRPPALACPTPVRCLAAEWRLDALQGKVGLCRLGSQGPDLRLNVLSHTALPTERSLELVILLAFVVQTRKKLRDMLQGALWNSCLQVGTSRLQGMRFHAAMGLPVPFESSVPHWKQVSFSH
eukprot:CAMPEP_0194485948 /NCGR_PEP_ID=MMETSP0253-20130528/6777_1 /TAXON_ID=2966 /ORGANISM="Noctiluca scintillans" /LENGTH=147 /DNA_ID=CAMNT_0039325977 /DNA_START=102 /DNA_END=546 /DNA_ORIENTATION=-